MKKGQLLAANYQNYIGNDGSPIKNLPGVDENPEDEDQCNVATEEEENPANITHEPSEIIAQALTEEPIITIHQSSTHLGEENLIRFQQDFLAQMMNEIYDIEEAEEGDERESRVGLTHGSQKTHKSRISSSTFGIIN